MHLLESVIRVNRKQVQLEQLILLLIRCAIPILLALCLARMVVTDWGTLSPPYRSSADLSGLPDLVRLGAQAEGSFRYPLRRMLDLCSCSGNRGNRIGLCAKRISSKSMGVPSSTVILMDDSFSMNADGGFETAGNFAEGFLDKLKKGSEATVVRMGGTASPIFEKPTSRNQNSRSKVRPTACGFGQSRFGGVLR